MGTDQIKKLKEKLDRLQLNKKVKFIGWKKYNEDLYKKQIVYTHFVL